MFFCDVKLENIVLDRDGYAVLVDMGSAEIGPSNVLEMPTKFLCFWTSFIKLQCRDIWKFAKVIQDMIEKKVHGTETQESIEKAMDFVKYCMSLENSPEVNTSHYLWMKSHYFFKDIYWTGLLNRTIRAPSFKIGQVAEDSRPLSNLVGEIASGCGEDVVPLSNVDAAEWSVEHVS